MMRRTLLTFCMTLLALVLSLRMVQAQGASSGLDRSVSQWQPYLEWQVSNPSYAGNPFDLIATVSFSHSASGETHSTSMFYAGGDNWAFRFTGTQTGVWQFSSQSADPELDGLSGRVTVTANPDPEVNGFVKQFGNKWGFSGSERAFVPQFVMAGGPEYYAADMARLSQDIQTFMVGHGFTGLHVQVFCRWFRLEEVNCDNIDPATADPDLRTFDALDQIITQVHAQGGLVHLWAWGDSQRSWNPAAWGLNGTQDLRLQRYIAARLGPLPGWTMGYGFDLWEWVDGPTLEQWHDNLHNWMGWDHYLGARATTNTLEQLTEVLDYASYEQHRPTYDTYVQTIEARPDKPAFSEDRFRIRDEGRSKDYSFDDVRRGLWHSTMAGGVANIWGNLLNTSNPDSSMPFPNQAAIKTYFTFFQERFFADMARCNQRTDGVCLYSPSADSFVFYAQDTDSVHLDLSGMSSAWQAIAVDTLQPYAEIDLGLLQAENLVWTAPYPSDWALWLSSGLGPAVILTNTPVPQPPSGGSDPGTDTSQGENSSSGSAVSALQLRHYVQPGIAFPGQPSNWFIEVRNAGSVSVTDVNVNDTLPDTLVVQSTSASAGTVNRSGQHLTWAVGALTPGATASLVIHTLVAPRLDGDITNTVLVSAANTAGVEASTTAQFIQSLPLTGDTPLWASLLSNSMTVFAVTLTIWL